VTGYGKGNFIVENGWKLAKKKNSLLFRAKLVQSLRDYFTGNDYLEIETPQLVPAPIPEEHIDAFACGAWFLHTSPEICMKRLLAAGYPRIFQICKCFREAERGRFHLPEFTMLEWYRRDIDYLDLMKECEELINSVRGELRVGDVQLCHGTLMNWRDPWERISVEEAFSLHAPLALSEALERGIFDETVAYAVAPCLGNERPCFLYDYPAAQGSLARTKKTDPAVAERFELFVAGIELANGFSELTDANEQRLRFERTRDFRRSSGHVDYPLPERFLYALESMPDSAGVALGVDRLAMILMDLPSIDDAVAFTSEDL
jgi:lysyl-tRNA synthetase class 2